MTDSIFIEKRYCKECGKRLIIEEIATNQFDIKTGEPTTIIRQSCPKYIKGRNSFFGSYWEHDSTRIFDVTAKK